MDKTVRAFITALAATQTLCVCAAHSPFASRIIAYTPSPGQNVGNPAFNDPSRATGAPIGGGVGGADNTKVVTLGGFGGSITLGFDRPIPDLPPTTSNPGGIDFIVFGNSFWVGGNPDVRWAEPGIVEVSRDTNSNGLADDPWYVIRGSHLPEPPVDSWTVVEFAGGLQRSGYRLTDERFIGAHPALVNPGGSGVQQVHGYADCSPTAVLGDCDGDGVIDSPSLRAEWFYTIPSDPLNTAMTRFSGGGDGVDISSAVLPDGSRAGLEQIDFVRITTAVHHSRPLFGEVSTEVCGVAAARTRRRADVGSQAGVLGPDGVLDNNDFIVFIDLFFMQSVLADIGVQGAVPGSDGAHDNNDFVVLIDWFFSGD